MSWSWYGMDWNDRPNGRKNRVSKKSNNKTINSKSEGGWGKASGLPEATALPEGGGAGGGRCDAPGEGGADAVVMNRTPHCLGPQLTGQFTAGRREISTNCGPTTPPPQARRDSSSRRRFGIIACFVFFTEFRPGLWIRDRIFVIFTALFFFLYLWCACVVKYCSSSIDGVRWKKKTQKGSPFRCFVFLWIAYGSNDPFTCFYSRVRMWCLHVCHHFDEFDW